MFDAYDNAGGIAVVRVYLDRRRVHRGDLESIIDSSPLRRETDRSMVIDDQRWYSVLKRNLFAARGSHCWQVVSSLGLSRMPLLSRRMRDV